MNNRLIIVGAGGHGGVVADNAMANGYTDISFLDDGSATEQLGFPVIGKIDQLPNLNDGKTDFVLGIGNNAARKAIVERYDVNWVSLIHPSAWLGENVTVGVGTVVMAKAVINTNASVGAHCIINTAAIVEHDNIIADYVHVSPAVVLGGTVHVGELTHVGIGAVVKNNIDICGNCIIGAGATVVKNIDESGTYVGVPVRKIV
jgi:sugar O-acyltransferase (sialic acid O-acetyltransferase NeuD family)